MRPAQHQLDIYDVDMHLAADERQWAALRRKITCLDAVPDSAGMSFFTVWEPKEGLNRPVIVLWVNVAQHTDEGALINTCAHEASHAASQIFDHITHAPTGVDEPTAYLVGWITQWVWEHCKATQENP